jgi:hypothetical protein
MQYQPGTNSLSVFVDGVNQYGPGAQYAYLETDSDTVTFVSGLHVGASVKFTTTTQTTGNATDASVVTYDPPFTGGVPTNVEAKLAQTVSVKDFGAVGDNVNDDTAAFQAAIDYACATFPKKAVLIPAGEYKLTSCLDLTSGASRQRWGVTLIGDGTWNTILRFDASAGTMFECTGSNYVHLSNFYASGSVNVGIFQARSLNEQGGGNGNLFENVDINLVSNQSLNGGIGSIALFNKEGEDATYIRCNFWANLPIWAGTVDDVTVAEFDANCDYVGERAITYTPIYEPITTVRISCAQLTFVHCRMIGFGYNTPLVCLRRAYNVDFGNSFCLRRDVSTNVKNVFTWDMKNSQYIICDGWFESPFTIKNGLVCLNGFADTIRIRTKSGFYDGSSTNDVPLLYLVGGTNNTVVNCDFQLSDFPFRNQLPIKIQTSTFVSKLLNTSISFPDATTGGLNTLPQKLLANAVNTTISFGYETGNVSLGQTDGAAVGKVYVQDRYEIEYSFAKVLDVNTVTTLFTATPPSGNSFGGTVSFKGSVIAGWFNGAADMSVVDGEFSAYIVRDNPVTTLNSSIGRNSWGTPLNVDAANLTLTAPTPSTSVTGTTSVDVRMISNTSGAFVANYKSLVTGKIKVNASYMTTETLKLTF